MRTFEHISEINDKCFLDETLLERLLTFDEINWIVDENNEPIDSNILTFKEFKDSSGLDIKKKIFPKVK